MEKFEEIIIRNKDYALDMLKNLVSFASVLDKYEENGEAPFGLENKKALEFLLAKGQEEGFIAKNIDNYAGHLEYGTGEEILGILAHLDVMPVNKEEWVSDPFKLDIRDGKMYARGSVDDKGPLVCAFMAMKLLNDLGFKPKKRIRLIAGCDEESGSRCLERYLTKETKPTIGFSPDAEFPIIYGEKGMLSFDILAHTKDNVIKSFDCGTRYNIVPSTAKCELNMDLKKEFLEYLALNNYQGEVVGDTYITYGKAAHAMCPQNGINAAFIMFDFLTKYSNSNLAKFIDKYFLFDTRGNKIGFAIYDEDMKELTCNLAVVKINENETKIGFNCRVPLDEHFKVMEEKLAEATANTIYSYQVISKSNRHYVDPKSTLVKTLMNAYVTVTNDHENKPFTIGGGTYAREIGYAVAFGPLFVGREDVCHIANEYMYQSDFYKAIEIYMLAIYELTK